LKQNHEGPGAARNVGVKHANGEILVFVDADMTFDYKFLSELVTPIIEGKTKGTFSKNEYVSNWRNAWAKCWNINEGWEAKKRHPHNYPDRQKVFRAILKSEYDRVGGFTPGGYTDDYTLAEKLGYEAEAADGAIFYHKNPDNLMEIYLQARWAAKRKYKFGLVGFGIGLLRATVPFSLLSGTVKSVIYRQPLFIIFKIVYDTGSFFGILDYIIRGRGSK
jgi:glycosyltransferase involved in cell wall biosynthesis